MVLAETESGLLYRVEHIGKKVESPAGELTILRDVSFTVERGATIGRTIDTVHSALQLWGDTGDLGF